MMYSILTTLWFLNIVTAQTVNELTPCVTKENLLQMVCKFTAESAPQPNPQCKFTSDDKVVATTDSTETQDPMYKNRATIKLTNNICQLNLTGLEDKPKNFNCIIKQSKSVDKTALVDKKKTPTCSVLSVLFQSGTAVLLALLTLPLVSELL